MKRAHGIFLIPQTGFGFLYILLSKKSHSHNSVCALSPFVLSKSLFYSVYMAVYAAMGVNINQQRQVFLDTLPSVESQQIPGNFSSFYAGEHFMRAYCGNTIYSVWYLANFTRVVWE